MFYSRLLEECVVHSMHRQSNDDIEYIDFFLVADIWEGEPKIVETDRSDDIRWFSLNGLPGNLFPHVRNAIENYRHNIPFLEFGWNN